MHLQNRSFKAQISIAALCACAGAAFAQPANNLCANAQAILAPSSTAGTNVAATTDAPTAGACATNSIDVWYSYTHPAGGGTTGLTLSTCGGANFDTVIRVFTGNCGALTQVGCVDDSCGLQTTVNVTVTPGTTYRICVAGFNGLTGAFTLAASITAPPVTTLGPDVIVGDVLDLASWGTGVATDGASVAAYSIGTTSCNIGDANILWIANNNQHPVIGQNLYRIANNRMEMIGQSWLKHGFTALTENLCATCSGQGGAVLGVGCSDPYTAGLNGSQSRLGPKSHVNATTGFYPYPFTTPGGSYMVPPAAQATIGRRLQVLPAELNVLNAQYVSECQYITADDASYIDTAPGPFQNKAHNGLNNVSYRRVNGTFGSFIGATVRTQPAVMAWQALDPTVVVNSYDYQEGNVVCRYWVGAKVVSNGNGTWTYNYMLFNLNSDRSAASFTIPLSNVTTSAPFSRVPRYHSGEVASMSTAWVNSGSPSQIAWATPQTHAQNVNASALRWSTSATFAFTASTAPTTGAATLAFFKPGTGATLTLGNLPIPSAGVPNCAADFNGDGTVDFFDYLDFVDAFAANSPSADFNGDGTIDFFDYLDFVDAFAAGC